MPLGFVRDAVVCVPGYPDAAPCPAGQGPSVVQIYALEPGAASVLDVIAAPLDIGQSGILWGSAFCGVVLVYVLAHLMKRLRAFSTNF